MSLRFMSGLERDILQWYRCGQRELLQTRLRFYRLTIPLE